VTGYGQVRISIIVAVTYVLTVVSQELVHHASDRLTTYVERGRRHAWEHVANKTIVFSGSNGYFVIGYSGPAYLDGMHTDHFIAQSLRGHPIPDSELLAWTDRTGHRDNTTANVFRQLQLTLDDALGRIPNPSQAPQFHLVAGGWQWRRKAVQSFIWRLDTTSGPPLTAQHHACPSDWSMIAAAPPVMIGPNPVTPLGDALHAIRADPRATADFLAAEIRTAADIIKARERSERIGRDVMTVSLAPPYASNTKALVRPRLDPASPGADGYPLISPWVIEPCLTTRPVEITGAMSLGSEFWMIDLEGYGPRSGQIRQQARRPSP
jgi:hypothetical protein